MLLLFAFTGGAAFYIGCFYFSVRYKKPFMYFQVKEFAKSGNSVARSLLFALHIAILSAVLYGVVRVAAFFN